MRRRLCQGPLQQRSLLCGCSRRKRSEHRHGGHRRWSNGPHPAHALAERCDARLVRDDGHRAAERPDFEFGDRVGSRPVAIVNEAFVRRFLPGEHAQSVEACAWDWSPAPRHEIVGVVSDTVYATPREGMLATMYANLGAAQAIRVLAGRPADCEHRAPAPARRWSARSPRR